MAEVIRILAEFQLKIIKLALILAENWSSRQNPANPNISHIYTAR